MTTLRRRLVGIVVLLAAAVSVATAQTADKVYVTNTGAKYHRESCRSLAKSKIEMPLREAAARYGACKLCNPPVPATTPATNAAVSSGAAPEPAARTAKAGRCRATTKKGTQCSRNAKAGSSYCWQHGG